MVLGAYCTPGGGRSVDLRTRCQAPCQAPISCQTGRSGTFCNFLCLRTRYRFLAGFCGIHVPCCVPVSRVLRRPIGKSFQPCFATGSPWCARRRRGKTAPALLSDQRRAAMRIDRPSTRAGPRRALPACVGCQCRFSAGNGDSRTWSVAPARSAGLAYCRPGMARQRDRRQGSRAGSSRCCHRCRQSPAR